jgi:phospholipid-binding lipoprotein MlaA
MSRRAPLGAATLGAVFAMLWLGGCAVHTARPDYDPWEPVNREVFWFNQKVDDYVLEPVAKGWDWISPRRVKMSVKNFFLNARFPINAVNNLLQADLRETAIHMSRFMVNTTFGVVGLFDPATDWGLDAPEEDFGQTLGRWGLGAGPYFVVPLLGPSSLRDVFRFPVDGFISGIGFTGYGTIFSGAAVLELINFRAENIDTVARAKEASLDYYAAVRNFYLQLRRAQINDSKTMPSAQTEELYDVEQYDKEEQLD